MKLLHSSREAEMMPYHTSFFPPKNLSVVYWSHTCVDPLKNREKHFEQKSRTLPIIQRRRTVKDTTYAVPWIFSGFFFAMYICCVFLAFISSFHGYNNLYKIHIFINIIHLHHIMNQFNALAPSWQLLAQFLRVLHQYYWGQGLKP